MLHRVCLERLVGVEDDAGLILDDDFLVLGGRGRDAELDPTETAPGGVAHGEEPTVGIRRHEPRLSVDGA
jgi:hypothetical protein